MEQLGLPVLRTSLFARMLKIASSSIISVISTVLKNFYVDDCLPSLPSSSEAVWLVNNLRKVLISRGGFHLKKWISNGQQALESIPLHDRAKNVKDLDLTEDVLPVENDKFVFKTYIKEQ